MILNSGLSEDERSDTMYCFRPRGNRPELFPGMIFTPHRAANIPIMILGGSPDGHTICQYDPGSGKISGLSLCLGGSSPSTSFDCSGFVSWVINHCGNGWDVGRQTANGLMGCCDIIPPDSARPGNLIFFREL